VCRLSQPLTGRLRSGIVVDRARLESRELEGGRLDGECLEDRWHERHPAAHVAEDGRDETARVLFVAEQERGPWLHRLHNVSFRSVTRILEGGELFVRSASGAATELIRTAIIDGRLNPGERLKEEELARELGISRTPVREALLVLHAEGLVDAAPNRGATVRAHTAEDLDDLYQLRALLEGYAARRAAGRISDGDVERLHESCERFDALRGGRDDLFELVKENLFFHRTILDAAGSQRLGEMVRKVMDIPLVYRSYIWYSPDQTRISVHSHRQIVKALAARDAERAEMVMKEHIFEARDVLTAHVRELEADA